MGAQARISIPNSDEDLKRCFPAILELRPHLTAETFLERARRQMVLGYQLAAVEIPPNVPFVSVAGYRINESLAWGRYLYVDDLVTLSTSRKPGGAKLLLDWLKQKAINEGCVQLHLDSGHQRFDAHRFYLTQKLKITSHHFAIALGEV